MKKVLLLTVVTGLLSGTVLAADEHDHDANQAQEGEAMAPGMMMGMMNHEQMMQMHEHMQEMQALMTRISEEDDPDVRQELMQEHMASMQEGMAMMGGSRMGMTGDGDMSSMNMEERMSLMQNQMGMMQMMMEQMMSHYSQDGNHHE